MRYYRIGRPIAPGTYPELQGNEVLEVHNYSFSTYCEAVSYTHLDVYKRQVHTLIKRNLPQGPYSFLQQAGKTDGKIKGDEAIAGIGARLHSLRDKGGISETDPNCWICPGIL